MNKNILISGALAPLVGFGLSNLDYPRFKTKYCGLSKNSPSHAQQKRDAKKRKNIKRRKL